MLAHSEASAHITAHNLDDPPPPDKAGNASECALLYTSGTTGKPKGCLLSDFYFLNVGQRYLDEGGLCAVRHGEERLITPLPFFHMNALAVSTTAMILVGGLRGAARPLPSEDLVARRGRYRRHDRALPRA